MNGIKEAVQVIETILIIPDLMLRQFHEQSPRRSNDELVLLRIL